MLKVHDMLYQSRNFSGVNISEYLSELVNEFRNTHNESAKNIKAKLPPVDFTLDSKKALHLGLVVTEIFLNYFKYCYLKSPNCNLNITLNEIKKGKIILKTGNDNEGFDFNEKAKADTLGLPLIKDLAEGICEKVSYPTLTRNYYEFEISS